MFFDYRQNNSGGRFIDNNKVGLFVIVEADSAQDADNRAEDIGLYFDGAGDCNCCGNRWSNQYGQGTKEPTLYGQSIEDYTKNLNYMFGDSESIHVYYKNGKHEIINITQKQIEKNKEEKRKVQDSFWATCFNLSGIYSKKPVQVWKHETLNEYYDKKGNLGVSGLGLYEKYGVTYFASKDKKEVQEFIDTARDLIKEAYDAAESRMLDTDIQEKAKKTTLKFLKNIMG